MHIDVEQQKVENQQQPQEDNDHKKTRWQIDWKKFSSLFGGLVLLLALAGGIWWFFLGRDKTGGDDPVAVYDVAVMLKDQNQKDPEEDFKSSLKAGDVVMTRETSREWSNTERISYLIIKMKLKQSQAQKLTEPVTEKISKKEGIEQGLLDEERMKEMEKEEIEMALTRDVRARKYRI
ncbi:MAG: hypothetical protein U9O20_02685, partial [Patescibacteria group bacterium]|nr:hypothetical protein [Patescibacteria group bacterium]